MDLKTALQEIIKGDVSSDTEVLEKHSRDASIFEIKPQLVIAPKEVEDIKHLVKFISENPSMHLSLTPRAAGTDMSGGAINESIVLSMTEHFNHIVQIGKDFAVTEPGVYYRDFEAETLKHNLFLPCYPSSRQLCTVGGMVGNNAAGEKTLSFGQTKDYVERLKAVLSDGNEYSLEPLSITELNKKLAQTDFEGAIYKKMYNLLEENFEKVQHARPRTSKNSTGYLLWDVWDRKTFDLTKIFVGSQGTLGVITKVMFRLVRPNTYSKLVVFFIYDLTNLGAIVNKVLAHKPESFELYDDQTLRYAGKYWPDIVDKIQPKSLMNLFLGFFPEAWMEVTHGLPKLVLMAEFTGESEQEVEQKCQSAKDDLKDYHLIMKITEDQDDAKRYWVIRRESFNLFRLHSGGGKRTAPFIDDLIIPPQYLPEFLPKLNALLAPYKQYMTYTIAGHVGNGNFHIIPLMDLSDEKTRQIIYEVADKVFDLVFSYGGSMSGEHNDGLVRGQYLPLMYGEQIYQLFKEVKSIFDPRNIFNPHKKTDATFEYSINHIAKS